MLVPGLAWDFLFGTDHLAQNKSTIDVAERRVNLKALGVSISAPERQPFPRQTGLPENDRLIQLALPFELPSLAAQIVPTGLPEHEGRIQAVVSYRKRLGWPTAKRPGGRKPLLELKARDLRNGAIAVEGFIGKNNYLQCGLELGKMLYKAISLLCELGYRNGIPRLFRAVHSSRLKESFPTKKAARAAIPGARRKMQTQLGRALVAAAVSAGERWVLQASDGMLVRPEDWEEPDVSVLETEAAPVALMLTRPVNPSTDPTDEFYG